MNFARETGDGVAERVIILCYHPDDRASALARETILPEFGTRAVPDRQVIITSRRSSTSCSWLEVLGASKHDTVPQDFLTSITAEIERTPG